MAIKELATELSVTEVALKDFLLKGIPNIAIATQTTLIAKLIDARDATAKTANDKIAVEQAKLEQMQSELKKAGG